MQHSRNKSAQRPARHHLFTPLTMLVLGVVTVVTMLAIPPGRPAAQDDNTNATQTRVAMYATGTANVQRQTQTAEVAYPLTQTAAVAQNQTTTAQVAQTQTAAAASPPTNTPTLTNTPDNGGGDSSGGGSVAQNTSTPTTAPERTNTPTLPPFDTPVPVTPSNTPTPLPTVQSNFLACLPDVATLIEGETLPNVELVLFFDENPIGGGLSNSRGFYQIPLQLGDERPGRYLVEVKLRTNRVLVRELICDVPAPTPRLTP
ncbi:MAG: hypothetical protein HC876_19730 [Chloroflexaceae bacterium]|nr:hypothetical protein [Chloroflexaceae bacterium]